MKAHLNYQLSEQAAAGTARFRLISVKFRRDNSLLAERMIGWTSLFDLHHSVIAPRRRHVAAMPFYRFHVRDPINRVDGPGHDGAALADDIDATLFAAGVIQRLVQLQPRCPLTWAIEIMQDQRQRLRAAVREGLPGDAAAGVGLRPADRRARRLALTRPTLQALSGVPASGHTRSGRYRSVHRDGCPGRARRRGRSCRCRCFSCSALKNTSRWSISPSTAATSMAQTPHSPRWQSEITSKPAAFSASSIERSLRHHDLVAGRLRSAPGIRAVGSRPLEPKVSKRRSLGARPASFQARRAASSIRIGPHRTAMASAGRARKVASRSSRAPSSLAWTSSRSPSSAVSSSRKAASPRDFTA